MTRDEAARLASRILARKGWKTTVPDAVDDAMQLARFVLAQSGAADSVPPAVPSEHGLQNAVPAPGGASAPPGDSRGGSLANLSCCNQCSGEHHHCPGCGEYVKGEQVVYCSTRCKKGHKEL